MDDLANVKSSASRIGETPAFPLFEWRAKRTGHGEPQDVEYPSGGGCGQQRPNPVVPEKPVRRRFDAEYKARILREADQFTKPRQRGALLRREGLYSSHLSVWRCGTRRPRTQAAQAEDQPECAARRREPAARPGERTTHEETSSDGGRSERPQKTLRDLGAPAAAQRLRNRATKAVEELTPSVGSRRVRSHRCAAAGIATRL
jgi:hypothetical protein